MTTVRRYAQGTTVSVATSRGEISGILTKHGVETQAWGTRPQGDLLQFELGGHTFRFTIDKPGVEGAQQAFLANGGSEWGWQHQADQDQWAMKEWMRRWRAHVLLIKAKLEFIDSGDTTLEREFMPYMVVNGGQRTLGEWLESEQGAKLIGAGA